MAHSALTAGDFEHDEFQGSGSFHATNGDHYEGAWHAGKQVLMLGVRCAFSLLLCSTVMGPTCWQRAASTRVSGTRASGTVPVPTTTLMECASIAASGNRMYASAHVVQSVMCVSFNVLRQLKHGRGTFTYENGDRYDGEFLNGKQVRFRPPSHAYVITHGAISLARKGRDLDEERKCTSV